MNLRLNLNSLIYIGIVFSGLLLFIITLGMSDAGLGLDPGDYPRIISIGLILCGSILFTKEIIHPSPTKRLYSWKSIKKVLLLVLISLIYVNLINYLGFLYLTPVLMWITMCLFEYRNNLRAILISVIVSVIIYYVFHNIFKVPLPSPSLF